MPFYKTVCLSFVISFCLGNDFCLAQAPEEVAELLAKAAVYYKEKDYSAAMQAYLKAVDYNDSQAMVKVGDLYFYGLGVRKNYQQTMKWYLKAAELGNTTAMLKISDLYFYGYGVSSYPPQYQVWQHKAADLGDPLAQYYVLSKLDVDPINPKLIIQQQVQLLEESAQQGNTDAMTILGRIYIEGYGHIYGQHGTVIPADKQKVLQWFLKAAELGNVNAMNSLGIFYESTTFEQGDNQKAVEWFTKAAERGNSRSMEYLGGMYYYGQNVEQDYLRAMYWFKQAVNNCEIQAMEYIGDMYEKGLGVKKDLTKARRWHKKYKEAKQQEMKTFERICINSLD